MSGAIVLVGPMGSGKTQVGAALAERLGRPFVDVDALVERRAGRSVSTIFEDGGEEAFREREAEAVLEASRTKGAVIACGGGAVLDPRNTAALRTAGTVIYLEVSPAVAALRVGGGQGRPLLAGREVPARLAELIDARRADYEAAAHHRVDAGAPVPDVVDAILRLVAEPH